MLIRQLGTGSSGRPLRSGSQSNSFVSRTGNVWCDGGRNGLNLDSERHRGRSRIITKAAEDDEAPPVFDDWRAFRAQLVASQKAETPTEDEAQTRTSESNMRLLEIQDPALAAEGVWAHSTPVIEKGGILLATPQTPEILASDALWQIVVVIVSHGPEGSMGLILNRPTALLFGKKPGGLRFTVSNASPELQDAFADSRVYCGGDTAQQIVHLLHPHPLPESVQIVQGVYLGGEAAAAKLVQSGVLPPNQFKFFSGAMVWEPGQLEREIQAGCWYTAACSRSLVIKQCLQLPTPLWREIMLLMGGEFAEVARSEYEGDEVSGE